VAGTLALPTAEDGAPPRALLPPSVAFEGPFGECFPVVCRRAPPPEPADGADGADAPAGEGADGAEGRVAATSVHTFRLVDVLHCTHPKIVKARPAPARDAHVPHAGVVMAVIIAIVCHGRYHCHRLSWPLLLPSFFIDDARPYSSLLDNVGRGPRLGAQRGAGAGGRRRGAP